MLRIFKVETEWSDMRGVYSSYDVAAKTAEDAILKVRKKIAKGEQVLGVSLLASESE